MGRGLGVVLDWGADHVGDIYFGALAVIAIGALVAGVVYVVVAG